MADQWFYFGCHREPGHYLFRQGMVPHWSREGRELSRFDGMLPPQNDTTPYVATVSRLEGWGMTALAFWDYSVDKRGGCNSVVFAPSLTITAEELLAEAQTRFPQVFSRLPQPVRLAHGVDLPAHLQRAKDEVASWPPERLNDLRLQGEPDSPCFACNGTGRDLGVDHAPGVEGRKP